MKDDFDIGMDRVFIAEVIITSKLRRGKGIENDPIRIVTEVFKKNGTKIAEYDPCDPFNGTERLINA